MSTDPYLPQILVNTARASMQVQRADLVGTWPRVSATLARQALELGMVRFWEQKWPGVESASMRAQLICLEQLHEAALAQRARYLWHALSNACHQHPYDLPPTEGELGSWIEEVAELLRELESTAQNATS